MDLVRGMWNSVWNWGICLVWIDGTVLGWLGTQIRSTYISNITVLHSPRAVRIFAHSDIFRFSPVTSSITLLRTHTFCFIILDLCFNICPNNTQMPGTYTPNTAHIAYLQYSPFTPNASPTTVLAFHTNQHSLLTPIGYSTKNVLYLNHVHNLGTPMLLSVKTK
jgi:hypothetical protein